MCLSGNGVERAEHGKFEQSETEASRDRGQSQWAVVERQDLKHHDDRPHAGAEHFDPTAAKRGR
jgi:hypothetical protein